MLPRKGQPFPPERRNCSHTFRGVLQFRLPSAPQRYNTLDFPTENRVPTGMLLAPIGNPEPKRLRPSGHPCQQGCCSPLLDDPEPKGERRPPLETSRIFCGCGYPNCEKT